MKFDKKLLIIIFCFITKSSSTYFPEYKDLVDLKKNEIAKKLCDHPAFCVMNFFRSLFPILHQFEEHSYDFTDYTIEKSHLTEYSKNLISSFSNHSTYSIHDLLNQFIRGAFSSLEKSENFSNDLEKAYKIIKFVVLETESRINRTSFLRALVTAADEIKKEDFESSKLDQLRSTIKNLITFLLDHGACANYEIDISASLDEDGCTIYYPKWVSLLSYATKKTSDKFVENLICTYGVSTGELGYESLRDIVFGKYSIEKSIKDRVNQDFFDVKSEKFAGKISQSLNIFAINKLRRLEEQGSGYKLETFRKLLQYRELPLTDEHLVRLNLDKDHVADLAICVFNPDEFGDILPDVVRAIGGPNVTFYSELLEKQTTLRDLLQQKYKYRSSLTKLTNIQNYYEGNYYQDLKNF